MKKRINIYLTSLEKKKMYDLKIKYHISFSTIANIVCKYICGLLYWQDLQDNYIEGKEGYKTSIKPQEDKYKNASFIYTNTLKIFLNDRMEKYMKDEITNKEKYINQTKSKIHNEMKETYEENWDGNKLHRLIPRMIKANPDYYRRLLEK